MPWQPAEVLFPDAELLACTAIRSLLVERGESAFVANGIPATRRERMVIFNRDGGSSDGLHDNPRMRCRVWAPTDQAAIDLARLVVAVWPLLVDGAPVVSARHESGPYDVPDESGAAQKYLLLNLRTRGVQQ